MTDIPVTDKPAMILRAGQFGSCRSCGRILALYGNATVYHHLVGRMVEGEPEVTRCPGTNEPPAAFWTQAWVRVEEAS